MSVHLDIDHTDRVIDIDVTGADVVLGLRSHFELPLSRVVSARATPTDAARADLRARVSGVRIPALVTDGHFRGYRAPRQWWCVHRADEVLAIDLAAQSPFDRIVVEVPDAAGVAGEIRAAIDTTT